jgi:predicted transglutaminase-like protease
MPSMQPFEKKQRKAYKDCLWLGYCPKPEEILNNRIKELSNRLKSSSDKETLTNLLDWQNRNLTFWFERYPMSDALWTPLLGLLLVTAIFFIVNPAIWLWSSTVILSVWITALAITLYMIKGHRKLPLRTALNMFSLSLPINAMLDNKLCVCRDYAKLSAALLFNIYPDKEVYFVHARNHVATGIMVGNTLYVLDKYLPLSTINKWHEKWNKKWYSTKAVEKVRDGCLKNVKLESILTQNIIASLNLPKIETELEKQLNIHRPADEAIGESIKLLHWKKGAILYEDDELVNYSLAQRLKTIITNLMIDYSNVKRVVVERKKDDLVFMLKL